MRIFSRKRARPTRKDACGPSDIAGAGSSGAFDDACPDVVPLWCLRALVHLEGRKRMVRYGNVDEDILDVVGLGHLPDDELQERPLKAALERRLVALEARAPALPDPLARNLHLIGEPLSLDRAERLLLAFAVLARTSSGLLDCTRTIVLCSGFQSFIHALSVILRLPEAAVRAALRGDGRLAASGLLRLNIAVANGRDFADRLVVLDDLAEALLVEHESPETLFRPFFSPAPAPRLSAQDLSHLGEDYELVASYLRNAGREGLPGMNILVFGPPGTGKTEFAHYLARELGKPPIVKRASDILSPYVGVAEQHIAAMFERAASEQAILLLDEADSFLRERAGAQRSWEVTQVNELLVQMEAFEGVFICSTNLMSALDEAALRRFDLEIKLDYLRPEQAWRLFLSMLPAGSNKMGCGQATVRSRLAGIKTLTPGDFVAVARRAQILGETLDPDTLLRALQAECSMKKDQRARPIGFVTAA